MIKAEIYILPSIKSNRTYSIITNIKDNASYWAITIDKNGNAWSVRMLFEPNVIILPDNKYIVELHFLYNDAYNNFVSGDKFSFYEGKNIIANGYIL